MMRKFKWNVTIKASPGGWNYWG